MSLWPGRWSDPEGISSEKELGQWYLVLGFGVVRDA